MDWDTGEAISLLRNKEIRIYAALLALILVIGSAASLAVNITAGITAFSALLLSIVISLLYTRWRYKQLNKLSNYLKRIANGEYALDIRDNNEGELSILKNEIYKVTVTLNEHASLLNKDKLFLADSISNISHQLKTPLTSMFVMTDLIQDEGLPQQKRMEFTQNIRSQLDRLQWLVASLLKLSKIDAGTIEFKKENVNVKSLIDSSVEHLLIPVEIKEQTLEIKGDDSIGFTGDFNWSLEAIANVVKNCIEHTPRGGTIGIRFSETSLYTMIEIVDNGEGVHKNDLPHIFDRFYKGKNAGSDSIGIGLALSKSIVESQGGTIEVSSEKDKGTHFSVKFYKGTL